MNAKIDAVGVVSLDLSKTVEFYSILGFEFPEFKKDEDHVEAKNGGIRLMIDSEKLITELLGEKPKVGNTSIFALLYNSPEEVDEAVKKLEESNFKIIKNPWDAFWGQRYAVVEDPYGYRIDLFASL